MYSSLKTVAGISVVISVINAAAAILSLMFLAPLEGMTYNMVIAFAAFLFSTSILFLLLSFYLFSLHADLSAHEDSNYDDISALRRRVENLEKTIEK